MAQQTPIPDEEVVSLFERCSNRGRWGADDELGTLNYVTPAKRRQAAALVREGTVLSLAQDLSTVQTPKNSRPLLHLMAYEQHHPISALDYIGFAPHGFAYTHLDAITHVYWRDRAYNGRDPARICTAGGLTYGSIYAQREGIVTRGVLLDVAAARGVDHLAPTEFVTPADLEAAERLGGVRVESGDCLLVRVGLEAREAVEGPEDIARRAGLHHESVRWLHEREVAVYSGDCVERMPYPSPSVPLPLHQVGLAAMGLVLLDCTRVEELAATCRRLGRHEFLLTVAPLRIPGGTGCPVNPLAVF